MVATDHMQVEQASAVTIPRVLVCYYHTTMMQQEHLLVCCLVADLQSAGVEVVLDEIHDLAMPLSSRELQSCQWVLLVQAKDTSSFTQLVERLEVALDQTGRQYLQGILHVLTTAPVQQDATYNSNNSLTFDASIDYPRALAGIVLTVNPAQQESLYGIRRGAAPAPPVHRLNAVVNAVENLLYRSRSIMSVQRNFFCCFGHFISTNRKLQVGSIVLVTLLLLGTVVMSLLIPMLGKTKGEPAIVTPIATPTPTSMPTSTALPTPVSPQEIYAQVMSKTPVIDDPLQSQDSNNWDIVHWQGGSCAFVGGAYHVSASPSKRQACLAENTPKFGDLALQVDMKLIQGDVGGILFRASGQNAYYWFSLDSSGCYRLVLLLSNSFDHPQILSNDKESCLQLNMHDTKQLTVIAEGSQIYLYIDGQFTNQFRDTTLSAGQIGVVCISREHPVATQAALSPTQTAVPAKTATPTKTAVPTKTAKTAKTAVPTKTATPARAAVPTEVAVPSTEVTFMDLKVWQL